MKISLATCFQALSLTLRSLIDLLEMFPNAREVSHSRNQFFVIHVVGRCDMELEYIQDMLQHNSLQYNAIRRCDVMHHIVSASEELCAPALMHNVAAAC